MSVNFKNLNIFLIFCFINSIISKETKCNQRLLQNFGLDGLWDKENAKDSLICTSIKSEDNCCSEIDEIKIVKLWNDFSLPKIEKFREDNILVAKKILNIAPFIKTLNVREIEYHAETLIWKKNQEKKCFNGKYFVSETNLKDMLKDQQLGDDWYTLWAKRALSEIINKIIVNIEKYNFMEKKHLFRYIVDPFYKDKKLFQYMMKVKYDFYEYTNKRGIITQIYRIFNSVQQQYLNLKAMQGKTLSYFLNYKIKISNIVYTVVNFDLPNKEIRIIKDNTLQIQMNKLINALKQNQKSIIAFKSIDNSTRKHFIDELIKYLWEDRELKYMLSFLYWPHPFEKNNENHKVLDEINARFVKGISYVAERVPLGGVNKYTFLQHVIKNMQQHFHIVKILQKNLYKILLPYMIRKMMPRFRSFVYNKMNHHHSNERNWKGKLINKIPFKKIRNHFWGKLSAQQQDRRRKYYQMMRRMNNLSNKLTLNLPYFKGLHDLRAPIIQAMKSTYESGVASIPQTFRPHGALSKLGKYQTDVATQLNALLMRDVYVEFKDDKKVCAVIIRHDLFKKIHFNKKKFEHCKKMYGEFKKLNPEQLLLPIEEMKIQLEKLNNMKKGFYCDLCSKSQQQFIDIEKKQFIYSEQFCLDLLTEFKSYIEWKNSQFIDFLSTTFQYMQCYAMDGTDVPLPYEFFGQDHLKDVKLVKECGNVKNLTEAKKCQKICENFDYVYYSKFFDGERKFLEKMYTLILNVVRKHGFKFQVTEAISSGKELHYNSNITIEDLEKDLDAENKLIKALKDGQNTSQYIKRSIISSKKPTKQTTTTKKGKGRILSLYNLHKHRKHRKLQLIHKKKDYIDAFSKSKQLVRVKKWNVLRGEWVYEYVPYRKAIKMRKLKEEKKKEEKEKKQEDQSKKIEELKKKVLASDELQKIISEIELQIKKKHKAEKIIAHFKTYDKGIYHDVPKNFIKKIIDTKNIDESTLKKLITEITKVKVETLEKEKKDKAKKEWEEKYKNSFLQPLPKIKLIKTISEGGDKIVKFTKPNYYKYDEIHSQEGTYKQSEPNIDFKSFKAVFQTKGLQPSKLVYKTNFSKDILEQIWRRGTTQSYEVLNKEVLRDYLVINKNELEKFNGDFKLDMKVQKKEVIKSLRPKVKKTKKTTPKDNKAKTDTTNQNKNKDGNKTQVQQTTNQQTETSTTKQAEQTQPEQKQDTQTQQKQETQAQQKRVLRQNQMSSKQFYNIIVKLLF